MKFRLEFRGTLEDIYSELSTAIGKGNITSKSAGAADIVSLGDTWLNFVISKMLIKPVQDVDDQDWFHTLSDKWKVRFFYHSIIGFIGAKKKTYRSNCKR